MITIEQIPDADGSRRVVICAPSRRDVMRELEALAAGWYTIELVAPHREALTSKWLTFGRVNDRIQ